MAILIHAWLSLHHRQVGLADFILLNKTDLVPAEELAKVEAAVRSINANAVLYPTQFSK